MKKSLWVIAAIVVILSFSLPNTSKAAIADGTYSVNYQVNKPGSSSASMANDYFIKPAKLVVNNGKMVMQLTIKNSSWVTQFNPPGGAAVISQNASADQRVVQFNVSNADVTTIAMKIDIDDIDYHHSYSVDFVFDSSGLPEAKAQEPVQQPQTTQPATPAQPNESPGSNTSHNKPTAQQAPATSSNTTEKNQPQQQSTSKPVETPVEESVSTEATETSQVAQGEEIENPETSDHLPMLYVLVFIGAAIVFMYTKKVKIN